MFELRLFENRDRRPYDIEIAIHPILELVLALHKMTALTYIATEFGKPFSIKRLGNRISDWFRQAGRDYLTAHSVRKGLATDVAHNEATDSARGDIRLARWQDIENLHKKCRPGTAGAADCRVNQLGWSRHETARDRRRTEGDERLNREQIATPALRCGGMVQVQTATPQR